jgi:DNA-binding FadR family transcriptional regulator
MEAAARRRAARDFNEADFQFHDAIFETCGHETLHEVWRGMQRRIRAFLASSNWVSGDLEAVAQRHRAILRALASRKLSAARRALRAHFARLHEELRLLLAGQSREKGRGSAEERTVGEQGRASVLKGSSSNGGSLRGRHSTKKEGAS